MLTINYILLKICPKLKILHKVRTNFKLCLKNNGSRLGLIIIDRRTQIMTEVGFFVEKLSRSFLLPVDHITYYDMPRAIAKLGFGNKHNLVGTYLIASCI